MKVDVTARRVGATLLVVSAVTLLLASLLAAPKAALTPNYKPRPVDLDESKGLPLPGAPPPSP